MFHQCSPLLNNPRRPYGSWEYDCIFNARQLFLLALSCCAVCTRISSHHFIHEPTLPSMIADIWLRTRPTDRRCSCHVEIVSRSVTRYNCCGIEETCFQPSTEPRSGHSDLNNWSHSADIINLFIAYNIKIRLRFRSATRHQLIKNTQHNSKF